MISNWGSPICIHTIKVFHVIFTLPTTFLSLVLGCPNLVFTTSVKHKFCCVIHPITFPPRPIFYISPPKFPFFNQTSLASNLHGSRDSTRPKWNFSTISAISVWLLIPYDALKPWFSINLFTACQLLSEMQDC